MLSTYFSFTGKGASLERYSVPHSSHTNMTNVGRYALGLIFKSIFALYVAGPLIYCEVCNLFLWDF
jgi:hypothetical protein